MTGTSFLAVSGVPPATLEVFETLATLECVSSKVIIQIRKGFSASDGYSYTDALMSNLFLAVELGFIGKRDLDRLLEILARSSTPRGDTLYKMSNGCGNARQVTGKVPEYAA